MRIAALYTLIDANDIDYPVIMLDKLFDKRSKGHLCQPLVDPVPFGLVFGQKQRFECAVAVEGDHIKCADPAGLHRRNKKSLPA